LDWDYLFVEAHTVGQDNWTTLLDQNGNTGQDTGESCPAGWHTDPNNEIHPQLAHYQTWNGADVPCDPTGTTGEWFAATGRSAGWQQWNLDLSAYAGQQVQVSISYVSDWGTQGIGVFLDDVTVSDGVTESFESDLGQWTVAGPPPGSQINGNDWTRSVDVGFEEGAVVAMAPTDGADFKTLYFGFGLEGVTTAAERDALIGRALDYLLT